MDFTNPAGGTDASVKRIKTVTGKMDLRHFTAANLARAMWGTTTAQTATPITGEAGYKINAGGFIATKRLIDITVAPVLKKGGRPFCRLISPTLPAASRLRARSLRRP